MTRRSSLAVVLAGLVLVLTYLLMPHTTPDTAHHQRVSDALRALLLNDAALQRDVLRARAGRLRNYDPLVDAVENLRGAIDTVRSDGGVAGGPRSSEVEQRIEHVASAVADQEALVEAFKMRNALLQNSLSFFDHTIGQFQTANDPQPNAVSAEVGKLVNAMLRFKSDPQAANANEMTSSLDRLAEGTADGSSPSVASLVAHGRLIVTTLPMVDESVSRLLAAATAERTRARQGVYDEAHAGAIARASAFGILLYIASLALVAYVGYLFLRLRANAQVLRARLEFERLIAAISAQFINLPRENIGDGINDGLARLAAHAGVDRAHIIVTDGGETGVKESFLWHRPGISAPAGEPDDMLAVVLHRARAGSEREGCLHIPDVLALPNGLPKAHLRRNGIRSWLCIPLSWVGKHVGYLMLDAVSHRRHWPDEDLILLRTAGEIFANAIERRRSESEREVLEARLHQTQRLESIGTLAGGIAHEFNNILGAIFGYAELTLLAVASGSRAEQYVRRIMTAGERAQAVVNQVLTFGRRRERQLKPVKAGPVVAEAVELLRASLPSTVAIETTLEAGDIVVMADPTELQQVVMNLCTNGAHAMENHGTLRVCLDDVEAKHALTLSQGSLPAGRYVRLSVEDTGSGIDAATLERILEPFFTTKPVGQGTGLGLPTVHGIVTQHGGALNVESCPGVGTTFEAYFPHAGEVAGEVAGMHKPPSRPPVPRGRGETILIVDDDAPLVPLAEEMLAALGYEAVGFDRSATALEAFRAAPDRFDLVLTDEVMPGMTGTELADAMHAIRPSLPIILMTGGGTALRAHRLHAAGIRDVLKKPLLSATIADLLARHLSTRGDSADENPAI